MRPRAVRAVLVTVLAVTVAACQFGGIRGSGEIVEQTHEVDEFQRLEVGHSFDVEVVAGDEPSVRVEADDNVMEHVAARVSGDTLRVRLRPGFQVRDATLRATVTTPGLEEIHASGAARVRMDGVVDGGRLRVESSGASEIVARVEVAEVDVVSSGASTVRLDGSADTALLEASGSSDLALGELRTDATDARLSGASRADVRVDDTLEAALSGSSALTYHGDPTITEESISGVSRLERG